MKKYICFSNYVDCKDGDKHFISAQKLPRLYNVNPKECIFVNPYSGPNDPLKHALTGTGIDENDLIHLWPDSSGIYRLPS